MRRPLPKFGLLLAHSNRRSLYPEQGAPAPLLVLRRMNLKDREQEVLWPESS